MYYGNMLGVILRRILWVLLIVLLGYVIVGWGVPFVTLVMMSKASGFEENKIELRDEYLASLETKVPAWVILHEYSCSFGDCAKVSATVDMKDRDVVRLVDRGREFLRVERRDEEVASDESLFEAFLIQGDGKEKMVDLNVFCYRWYESLGIWKEAICEQADELNADNSLWVELALGGFGVLDEVGKVTTSRDGFGVQMWVFDSVRDESWMRKLVPRWEEHEVWLYEQDVQIRLIKGMWVSRHNVVMHQR